MVIGIWQRTPICLLSTLLVFNKKQVADEWRRSLVVLLLANFSRPPLPHSSRPPPTISTNVRHQISRGPSSFQSVIDVIHQFSLITVVLLLTPVIGQKRPLLFLSLPKIFALHQYMQYAHLISYTRNQRPCAHTCSSPSYPHFPSSPIIVISPM